MNIYSWKELKQNTLSDLYQLDGASYGVFHSKGIGSDDLKKLILSWIPNGDKLKLKKSPNGKPYLIGSTWNFNLSHSGDYSAIVLHPFKTVGIDIEAWRKKSKLIPLVEKYYSKEEKNHLAHIKDLEDWEKEALEMWTIKEALIKRDGGDLFQGLKFINTMKLNDRPFTRTEEGLFALGIALEKESKLK